MTFMGFMRLRQTVLISTIHSITYHACHVTAVEIVVPWFHAGEINQIGYLCGNGGKSIGTDLQCLLDIVNHELCLSVTEVWKALLSRLVFLSICCSEHLSAVMMWIFWIYKARQRDKVRVQSNLGWKALNSIAVQMQKWLLLCERMKLFAILRVL